MSTRCECGHLATQHYPHGRCSHQDGILGCSCVNLLVSNQLSIDDALGDVIPSRSTDPATSHAAAREIKVRAGSQRALLLGAFFAWRSIHQRLGHGDPGMTDEQAMNAATGVSPTSEYSKRCSELREGGFIEPTGETRPGSAGPQRIVSRITDKGRRWVSENQ